MFCSQEAQLARSEAERMASLAGSQAHPSLLSLNTMMEDIPDEEKSPRSLSPASSNKDRSGILNWPSTNRNKPHCFTDRLSVLRLIEKLTKKLQEKEALVTELSGEKTALTLKVGELEVQVQELHSLLEQKDKDVEVSQFFSETLF